MNPEVLTDTCPDGSDHEPVVETDELRTTYAGQPLTTIKVTITCAKCGEACRPRYEEPYEEPCSN